MRISYRRSENKRIKSLKNSLKLPLKTINKPKNNRL